MKHPKGVPLHRTACCPAEYDQVPNYTGSFELDCVIDRNTNPNVPVRLEFYLKKDNAYGPRTNYNGYDGLSGDD